MNGALIMANQGSPSEGSLVVCTVTEVKTNGAYVSLDTYEDITGFIFIGEIASGWVKNVRGFVRKGQRLVCKVLRTRRDGRSLELSLKSVSEERRRETIDAWKNEQRATELLKFVGEKAGWDDAKREEIGAELTDAFGTLFGSFEDCARDETALRELEFEGDWVKIFIEIAIENIIPPFVVFRGNFEIEVGGEEGVETIRKALLVAESHANEELEVKVECYYNGAPNYRVELTAPDFELALETWETVISEVEKCVDNGGGTVVATKE